MSEQIQVALIGLIGVLAVAVIGTFLKLVFDQSDKKRIERLLEKTQELDKKLESTAIMIGTLDKSLVSLIGSSDKSLVSLIGNTDKSLVSLIGDTNHLSVSYKLDTLINENQKHKDSLASMNSDTKQMHTYILSYTQKFEENARLVEELNQKVKKLQDENKRLREENQGLKKEFEILKDNDDKSKETVDEKLDDIIGNLSHQNDEMDLER